MQGERDVLQVDSVNKGEVFIGGMVAELPGADGVESTDLAKDAAFLGELLVDEGSDGAEDLEPGFLDVVHYVNIIPFNKFNIFAGTRRADIKILTII